MSTNATAGPTRAASYPEAVTDLLGEFTWNSWFMRSYWPENEPRVRLMAHLALARWPDPAARRVLEVGCANGYVAYLFSRLAFDVSAVDAYGDEKRADLFRKGGVAYAATNLNDAAPLAEFPAASFDLVLLGEVFEHILNHPAGLLRGIHRILRPGGLLILTTPNPSTLANAVRLLRDKFDLWGTRAFMTEVKLEGARVIDRGDIHYREYPARLVRDLLAEVGFRVEGVRYVRTGNAPTHAAVKRFLKRLLLLSGLAGKRLFAPGYVIAAAKPA
jgi:SAM-dependent methyltransferase